MLNYKSLRGDKIDMAYLETMAIKTTLRFIKDLLQLLLRQKM